MAETRQFHGRDDLRNTLTVAAGLVVVTAIMLRPLLTTATHAIPGELRDPLLNTWILAWDAERIRHGFVGFWDSPILYPYRSTLAFSEHLLGIAVFAAPIVWLTGNAVLAYNAAFFASYVFAGVAMFLLARQLTGRTDAAIVAAAIFAFYPYRTAQVGHLQLLVNGWMPLTLLGLHRYFTTGSRKALAGAAIAYWFLAMSNGYYLIFFGLTVAAVAVWGLCYAERVAHPRMLSALTLAALLVGVAYAPIAREYAEVRHRYDLSRPPDEVRSFSADLGSYLTMPDGVRVHLGMTLPSYPKPAGPEERHDGMLFPGFVMLALAALAVLRRDSRRHPVTWLYLGLAVAALVMSLGPEPTIWGHPVTSVGPYAWVGALLPVLDALRVPARFASIVYLALTVLAAIGIASVLRRRNARVAAALTAVLVAAVCFEGYSAIPMAEVGPHGRTRDHGLYDWLRERPAGAVLELPIARLDGSYRSFVYQYNTLVHRHPIVNGWTGYTTELQQFLGSDASPFRNPDAFDESLDLLRGLGVRYVLVHPEDFDPRENAAPILAAFVARGQQLAMQRFGDAYAFTLPPAPAMTAPPLQRVDPASIQVTASHASDRVPYLTDGDRDTRWTTGSAQDGSEWIELRFDRIVDVRRLRFEVTPRDFRDYPRALEVDALDDDDDPAPLFRGGVLMAFGRGLLVDPMHVPIDIMLPAHPTRALRISQTGRSRGIWWWSIDELSVWSMVDGR
jgi:hypothetical protein